MNHSLSWLVLKSVPGIGNHIFKRLIDCFNSPEHILQASHADLIQVKGVTQRLASAIKNHRIQDDVKKDFDLVNKNGFKIITLSDPFYPALLLEIHDPPPFLYVTGQLKKTAYNMAVVGSRNATNYGISTTKNLCMDLSTLGFTIVSGMARGIDSSAHEGALRCSGKTVAVLGSGLLRIYPAENKRLFHEIAERGAVISEFPLYSKPEAHHFPMRNRIISGMSLGTVVVEATLKSGSLITARLAAEQNREVFAVPGSIQSFKSTGTHTLIKQGAKLIEHAQDVIDELTPDMKADIGNIAVNKKLKTGAGLPPLTEYETLVYKAIGTYPVHIDNLIRKISIEPGKLSSTLLQLELKGVIHQAPGNFFSISS